jgi:hypothetical protein
VGGGSSSGTACTEELGSTPTSRRHRSKSRGNKDEHSNAIECSKQGREKLVDEDNKVKWCELDISRGRESEKA